MFIMSKHFHTIFIKRAKALTVIVVDLTKSKKTVCRAKNFHKTQFENLKGKLAASHDFS